MIRKQLMTTSVNVTKVYDEIVDFIATGTTPESVINFKLSDTAQDRLDDLVYAHKMGKLTDEEEKELDNFLVLEHIMTLAKARAYKLIPTE
jgi:hypothetical protein